MAESALLRLLSRYPHPTALARIVGPPLYPLVARLESAGLVTRRRGLYRLTVRGRRELALDRALQRSVARGLSSSS
jgi:DNA-binding PadR family transcriptional regulator